MKPIPFLLMILLIIGCSSDWGTNSTDQEYEAPTAATVQINDADVSPVTEIEPETPLCETENFGYVELRNSSRLPLRCVIGDDISVIVRPNFPNRVQVPMGYHEVQWWQNEHSYYTCTAAVAKCKTTTNEFDPLKAWHSAKDR